MGLSHGSPKITGKHIYITSHKNSKLSHEVTTKNNLKVGMITNEPLY